MRGDWSWLKEAFDLQDWKQGDSHKGVCFRCPATCGLFDWKDSSLGSRWRGVRRTTHAAFMADLIIRMAFISEIFNFHGFQLEYVTLDFMHLVDLGVCQIVLGVILWELFLHVGGLVTKPDEGCGILLTLIKHFAQHAKTAAPINNLTLSMIRQSAAKPFEV